MKQAIKRILSIADKTYYNWKNEKRPIITLLETYFTESDLLEYIETGKISRYDNLNGSQQEITSVQRLLVDHAFYSLKPKLKEHLGGDLLNKIYTKGAKEILIDVLEKISPNDESFTIENSKDRLLDRLLEEELKWLSIKNPQKRKLLNTLIKDYYSDVEVYAMIKYSNEIIDYLKKN